MSGAEQVDIHDGSFQVGRMYKIREPRVRGKPLNLKVKSKDRRAGLELAVRVPLLFEDSSDRSNTF